MNESGEGANLAVRCVVVCAVTLAAGLVLVAPLPLDEPVSWGGDTLEHAVLVDSANWLGQPGFSEQTGAPHGVDWSRAPSGGERLNIAVISVLAGVTGNIWAGINLHILVALAATALAGFLVLRWIGVADLIAGGAAVVFALGSAVYDHIQQGHLFLFALYPVPLAVYLALRYSGWRPPGSEGDTTGSGRSALLLSAGCVLVVGLSSTYYSLFAVLTIAALAVLVALRNLDWKRAVPGLACAGSIAAVVAISSLPSLVSDAPRLERRISDSVRFALDPIRVFLPQSENLTGLTEWGSSPADAIGLAATIGVLWLGWVLLRNLGRRGGAVDGLLLRLAAVVGVSLAVGVPGGIGWLIARMGGQELRAWSRVSVFITFAGLAALAVLTNRAVDVVSARREPSGAAPRYLVVGSVAIVLLALLEQRSLLPERSVVRSWHSEAAAVVADMEESLPQGSDVLVLPAGSYLSDFGPGQVLALPLVGDRLRYSAGSFRGGPGDWQLSWALEPVESQLEAAAAGGFRAVVLQADHHRIEDPDGVVSAIEDVLGEPRGSVGSWLWWELDGVAGSLPGDTDAMGQRALRPLGVSIEGTPGFPSTSAERDYLIEDDAVIEVRDHSGSDAPVIVSFMVLAVPDSEVRLSWNGMDGAKAETVVASPDGTPVTAEVLPEDGDARVSVAVTGDPYRRGDDDPDAYAELRNVQAFDAGLGGAGFAVPGSLR